MMYDGIMGGWSLLSPHEPIIGFPMLYGLSRMILMKCEWASVLMETESNRF